MFSKMTHFIPHHNIADACHMAKLFHKDIVCLHGLPSSIESERDVKFIGYFLKAFWKLLLT